MFFRGGKSLSLALVACAAVLVAGAATSVAKEPAPPQKPHYRVMGGGPADFAQWPFAAAILYKGEFLCSGSVLDSRHVITAGHCGRGLKTPQLSVITGRADLRQNTVGQVIPVAAKFVDPAKNRHDISVFGLAAPTTSPAIALPTAEDNATGTVRGAGLRVAGWGATTPFQDKLPGFLKTTTVTALTKKPCFRAYGKDFKGVAMVCAQGAKLKPTKFSGRTSPCGGDSGGPLVTDTPLGARLIAVVSFGPRFCGDPFAPVVYARVSDDLPFIAAALAAPLP